MTPVKLLKFLINITCQTELIIYNILLFKKYIIYTYITVDSQIICEYDHFPGITLDLIAADNITDSTITQRLKSMLGYGFFAYASLINFSRLK